MLSFKKLITKTTEEVNKRAEVLEELLEAKKDKFKELYLGKSLDELKEEANTAGKYYWVELRKLQKLILEIRYLENNGDATRECPFEIDATSNCRGWVGVIDDTYRTGGKLDEGKKVELYKKKDGTSIKRYKFTKGSIEKRCEFMDAGHGVGENFWLTKYVEYIVFDAVKGRSSAQMVFDKIKNGEADLLADLEIKERFRKVSEHLEIDEGVRGLDPWKAELKNLIDEELDKDIPEPPQGWRGKLILKDTKDDRAEVLEELLEAKKDKLKEFPLEGSLDELVKELKKTSTKDTWIELLKLQKLILEIRYLENNGDATVECNSEKEAGDPYHIKGLVGTGTTNGTLDQRIFKVAGKQGEEHYLVEYFRRVVWENDKSYTDTAISKIKNGEDDLLEGIEFEEKLNLYDRHFKARELILGLDGVEKTLKKSIKEELDKNIPETAQDWRNKLKDIDSFLNDPALINNTWKDKWTAIGKFKKADEVKALFTKIKGKADFLTELPIISGEADLKTLKAMVAKEPKEIIGYIERYEYNKLDDTATNEKDKKKTQMKRRLAKALQLSKESEITDEKITEALVKVKTGELTTVDMSKFYKADLSEITTKKPEGPGKETKEPSFLRWDNPLVYAIGALAIGIVGVVIFWDKLVNLFNGDKEENN